MPRYSPTKSAVAIAGILSALTSSAFAGATLTPAGSANGFTLSTFASGFPAASGLYGPLGIAFTSSGGVLVSDASGNVRLFATDTDGQDAAAAPVGQNYGFFNAFGLAKAGGNFYMTGEFPGTLSQINGDGTFNQPILSIPFASGIIADPLNGHLLISTQGGSQLLDVDPVAKTTRLITTANLDGLSLSADGMIVYGANESTGSITGYNVLTGAQVFDSGFLPGGIDGTALGQGSLSNEIFGNLNSGSIVEVDLLTKVATTIVTGGSRGDFASVDPNSCSVLFTQSDQILRLTAPNVGICSFVGGGGGPPPSVSEPASLALLGVGLAGLGVFRRRRLM